MLSDEIKELRRFNVTASAAHKIMAGWNDKQPSRDYPAEIYEWIAHNERKPLVGDIKGVLDCECTGKTIGAAWAGYQFDKPPQGLITYAEELACMDLFEPDPDEWDGQGSEHIANGIEREEECVRLLSEATGIEFINTGDDQIHLSIDGIGATPDGLAYDELDLISDGCEVKCRSALPHARQLLIKDNASLIELDFDRFVQIQVQMLVSGVDSWYSANYNPLAKREQHKFHYCKITRDDAFLAIFKQRAQLTFTHRDAFLAKLMGDEQQKEAA